VLITDATARAIENVAAREEQVVRTLTPADLAAPDGAYFLTGGERGKPLYSRDGAFSLRGGTLVDAGGREVLGLRDDGTLAPLHADPIDSALELTESARIENDGRVWYERTVVDPRNGAMEAQNVEIGRLALARFAPGTKLQQVDAQHASAPPEMVPHVGAATDGNFGALRPLSRAASAGDIDRELEHLQEAYMALDALRAAGVVRSGTDKTAMDLLK